MKAIWEGSIAFGLVNIPVKIYSAAQPKAFEFHLLCGKCHTRLKYQRFCPKCKREVIWQDVVKGIEVGGKIHVITKKTLEKLMPKKTNTIEIISFIDPVLIDTIYFANNYYVVPTMKKEKAYFIFQQVLRASAKVALAKFTMHEKDHIAIIKAYKKGLLLTTLHYPYEIRDIESIAELKEKIEISKKEFELANILLTSLVKKEAELEKFRDKFAEKVKKALMGKIEKIKERPAPEKLVEALELSIKRKRK